MEILKEHTIDLLIIDVEMPGVDGMELVHWLRRSGLDPNAFVPVIMTGAHVRKDKVAKVRDSGLSDLFRRIEIVSEKDPATYARLFAEFGVAPSQFAMVGNSLRSDIAPVLELGGWGVHVPYHTTWAHEADAQLRHGGERMRSIGGLAQLPAAMQELAVLARG